MYHRHCMQFWNKGVYLWTLLNIEKCSINLLGQDVSVVRQCLRLLEAYDADLGHVMHCHEGHSSWDPHIKWDYFLCNDLVPPSSFMCASAQVLLHLIFTTLCPPTSSLSVTQYDTSKLKVVIRWNLDPEEKKVKFPWIMSTPKHPPPLHSMLVQSLKYFTSPQAVGSIHQPRKVYLIMMIGSCWYPWTQLSALWGTTECGLRQDLIYWNGSGHSW